jgi:hypothetical protein
MMTKMKTLSAVMILSTAVAMPAFARGGHHTRVNDLQGFRGVYNQVGTPSLPQTAEQLNIQNFGFSGKDSSRPGGWDPSLNPAGN